MFSSAQNLLKQHEKTAEISFGKISLFFYQPGFYTDKLNSFDIKNVLKNVVLSKTECANFKKNSYIYM